MDERDETKNLFDEIQEDIEELAEIEQNLYELAIKAATEPW